MKTELRINNAKIDVSEFVIPDLSLSSARSTMEKHEFILAYSVEEVEDKLKQKYAKWCVESKADDEQCCSPQDELAIAGYPSLVEVIRDSQLLHLVIGGYLFEDIMDLCKSSDSNPVYWFDKVTRSKLKDNRIYIEGECYTKSTSTGLNIV